MSEVMNVGVMNVGQSGKTPDGEQVGLSSPPFSPSQESDNEASLMFPRSQSDLVRRSPRTAKLEMIEMMQSIQEWSDLISIWSIKVVEVRFKPGKSFGGL